MGLYDRDYMRRRGDGDAPPPDADAGEWLEGRLQGGWRRRKKTLIAIGLCLLVLLGAAILNAILNG